MRFETPQSSGRNAHAQCAISIGSRRSLSYGTDPAQRALPQAGSFSGPLPKIMRVPAVSAAEGAAVVASREAGAGEERMLGAVYSALRVTDPIRGPSW